jgi:hypothetical protein
LSINDNEAQLPALGACSSKDPPPQLESETEINNGNEPENESDSEPPRMIGRSAEETDWVTVLPKREKQRQWTRIK